jgi:hypothetical protein
MYWQAPDGRGDHHHDGHDRADRQSLPTTPSALRAPLDLPFQLALGRLPALLVRRHGGILGSQHRVSSSRSAVAACRPGHH